MGGRFSEGQRAQLIPTERLAAPARRALANSGYATLGDLAEASMAEVAGLHGMGPNALRKLNAALGEAGLDFRKA